MLNIIWFLWALKFLGLTTMPYDRLSLISIGIFTVCAVLKAWATHIQQKQVEHEIDACKDVEDDDAVCMMLALILRKIALK